MRIPSGVTDQVCYFVAVDATDFTTRETGLASFTVYRSRNGGTATAMTTPTVTEVDATNMPGVYKLLLDEDMTIDAGDDSQEMAFHITHTGMAPVTRTIELYRPKITAGETLTVSSGTANSAVQSIAANTITATAIASNAITSDKIAADAIGASQIAADAVTEIQSGLATSTALTAAFTEIKGATWATTDTLEAIRDRGDAAWTTATGFSTLDAAGVRTAVGLASANLDTQLAALPTAAENATELLLRDLTVYAGTSPSVGFYLLDIYSKSASTKTAVDVTIPGLIANLPTDADVNAQCDTAISEYFGVAGSSLTGIPWNAAWDAEVQSECTDAINALFTFTVSGQVDANIQRINDTAIVGNGVSPKFGV